MEFRDDERRTGGGEVNGEGVRDVGSDGWGVEVSEPLSSSGSWWCSGAGECTRSLACRSLRMV